MKIRFAILFFLGIVVTGFTQDFEGKVTYSNVYKSKNTAIPDEQFNMMLGNSQEFYFKGGNYKNVPNGQVLQWQIYLSKDNKLYTKMSMSQSVYWDDGSDYPDEVLKAEVKKNAMEILGYSCDELTLTCKSGIQKYWYNESLKIDPKYFEKHKFQNWNEFVSRAKAVPLKISVDTKEFSVESIATQITKSSLDDKIFELPTGTTLEKNPFRTRL